MPAEAFMKLWQSEERLRRTLTNADPERNRAQGADPASRVDADRVHEHRLDQEERQGVRQGHGLAERAEDSWAARSVWGDVPRPCPRRVIRVQRRRDLGGYREPQVAQYKHRVLRWDVSRARSRRSLC